jgi:type I restriction enzyme M protein
VKLQKIKANSANSWSVDMKDVDQTTFDLSVKNPNKGEEIVLRKPEDIMKDMKKLDAESENILEAINKFL